MVDASDTKRQKVGDSDYKPAASQLLSATRALQQVVGSTAGFGGNGQRTEDGLVAEGRLKALERLLKQILENHGQLEQQGRNWGTGQRNQIFASTLADLQKDAEELQALLDKHSLPEVPDYCRVAPTVANAKRIATYAHKLSYTTFAPPVHVGQDLFRPPAPQELDFRASILHQLAGSQPGAAAASQVVPVEVPKEPMKAESMLVGPVQSTAEREMDQEQAGKAVDESPKSAQPATNSAFNFILNPDFEAVDEEYSSSDEGSEDD